MTPRQRLLDATDRLCARLGLMPTSESVTQDDLLRAPTVSPASENEEICSYWDLEERS